MGQTATKPVSSVAEVPGLVSALAGKAASVHTHATSDVTGLDAALAGKAASTHTHTVSDVTDIAAAYLALVGGTLTGNLVFSVSGATISTEAFGGFGTFTITTGDEDGLSKGGDILIKTGLGTVTRGDLFLRAANFTFQGGGLSGDAAGLTNIAAGSIATGTITPARLGSGTANSSTFLRGDSTYQPIPGGAPVTAVTNTRYFASGNRVSGGTGVATDRVLFSLIHLPVAMTINRIGVAVNTAVASTTVRLGLYTNGAQGPDALIVDGGTIDSSTTGDKEVTISSTALAAGYYWIADISGTATAGQQIQKSVNIFPVVSWYGTSIIATQEISTARTTSTDTGWRTALPSTAPAIEVNQINRQVWVRFV